MAILSKGKTKEGQAGHRIDPEWLGVQEGLTTPQAEVPATEVMEPGHFEHEYSEGGSRIREKHGIQHTFPSGGKHGGDAGIGKKLHGGKEVIK